MCQSCGLDERDAYTVWAAPGALGCFLHVGVQADHVVRSGTRVTQDDLSSLLAHLTVVLVVRLIAVAILCFCCGQKTISLKHLLTFSH